MSQPSENSIRARNWLIGGVLVVLLAALGWVWLGDREGPDDASTTGGAPVADDATAPSPAGGGDSPGAAPGGREEAAESWVELLGSPPRWPADFAAPTDCEAVDGGLDRVCAALDARVPSLSAHGGARSLIERLGEELAAAPPDFASELGSYDTIRRNVFHIYRVAGRDRLRDVRRALGEGELAEPAALAFYRWAITRGRCEPSRSHPVRREALYAYAGFLFNTLGGQAYLRRRSPPVEALACFYGLHALDGAIRDGYNPHGLDPRPEIGRCRALVDSQGLVFADRYVSELDAMARRWKQPGARTY